MALKELPSLVSTLFLILMFVLMDLSSGKAVKSRKSKEEGVERINSNCPTQPEVQENSRFPDNVIKVHLNIAHTEQVNEMAHDVSNRSLSPWDYSISEDPNRFPHVIAEASCHYTTGCLDLEGHVNYAVNSVPIKQEILVLKRKRTGCQQTYWLEKQLVTVGCTCVTPLCPHQILL
uniref:Interleukin 17F n=1 Tax=Salvator merianae TaxID=96440 RepID=A0A8D0B9E7_SALMN